MSPFLALDEGGRDVFELRRAVLMDEKDVHRGSLSNIEA
jgi:hypothetical protein